MSAQPDQPSGSGLAPVPKGDIASHVENSLHTWVYPERKRLTQLVWQGGMTPQMIATELARLTEAAARTLRVARASVWSLAADGQSMTCLDLFEAAPVKHSAGTVIPAAAAPNYFKALATERSVSAHDARVDPRTSEFTKSYLDPLGITSMLDAPIFVNGKLAAVVCHEHVGPQRKWQAWEELVASTFADLFGLVLEAQSRQRRPDQRSLEERTAEVIFNNLVSGEEAMRALVDGSPVPLVVTRASDHKVIYANNRALKLFDIDAAAMTETSAAGFWVNAADRQIFLERIFRDGRIDDFEIQLQNRTGRKFWARMSAEAVKFKGELALLGAMVDITSQRRAEENLRTVFSLAPVALVLSRLSDQTLLDGNQHAEKMFEIEVSKAVGRQAPDFWVHPADRERLRQAVKSHGSIRGFEAELKTHSGKTFWAELAAAVIDFDGAPALLVGGTDITERKRHQDTLTRMATTDGLTGVVNRGHFFELATGELMRAARYQHATSVAMLDLDHFKLVNDQLGHDRGDVALKNVVEAIKPLLRESDVLARYGGEEFCILLPQTALEGALAMLERVRAAVADFPLDEGNGKKRLVTVSIGAATCTPGESLDQVLRRADLALYEAKKCGRNRVIAHRAS